MTIACYSMKQASALLENSEVQAANLASAIIQGIQDFNNHYKLTKPEHALSAKLLRISARQAVFRLIEGGGEEHLLCYQYSPDVSPYPDLCSISENLALLGASPLADTIQLFMDLALAESERAIFEKVRYAA
jgi:hypothetical protein